MGQVATSDTSNLAFFSKDKIDKPLVQNKDPDIEYNHMDKYITFVIGDGDNIDFIK